ncbi:hypothetical protein AB4K20DRAFT_1977725 [Rhizopus microsporus]|uniref:Uncharacterized protein n=1 Tax=Rhizopus microsporus TaxID=58291 RepID=A0A1X0RKQ6_RHIZD|nr:hypothetical protein BCV71DRAFT_280389 [Rhizopus microsporus]
MLSSVGVNPSGFSKLLCTSLAINRFTVSQLRTLEEAQNNCIKKIYGARGKAITKVMLHMSKLPLMSERFPFRSLYLPEDALLACLLPYIRNTRVSQWYALSHSKLLSNCRRSISLDPILWLPMSKSERSCCILWRLGWLPGGKPRSCPKHPTQLLSKKHTVSCLDMHRRLFMPETIRDPLSSLLNMLLLRPSIPPNLALIWSQRWPIICSLLYELDQLHHNKSIPTKHLHGQKLLVWLNQFI